MLSKRRWTFQDLLKSAHLSSYRGWRIVGTRLGLFTPRDAAFLTSLIFKQEELLKPQEESFLFQSKDVREKPPAGRAGVLGSASGQALLWSAQTQQRNLGRTPVRLGRFISNLMSLFQQLSKRVTHMLRNFL
ncbi:uncharacterized protein LOC144006607 isoform X1 [Festucalex cinctus]